MFRFLNFRFFLSILFIAFLILACGKTETDEERESILPGRWVTTGIDFSILSDTVYFEFSGDTKGFTEVGNLHDDFAWEIVRNTLKTYYKEAPDYAVGYDKYNSQGVYSIKEFSNDKIKLEHHLYNGMYTVFTIDRVK